MKKLMEILSSALVQRLTTLIDAEEAEEFRRLYADFLVNMEAYGSWDS